MTKVALITGITGQDGAYLAEFLLMDHYDEGKPINVVTGMDITIADLATLIAKVVGYSGQIRYKIDMPDGTMRKMLDVSKIKLLGWKPQIALEEGITATYHWYVKEFYKSNYNCHYDE